MALLRISFRKGCALKQQNKGDKIKMAFKPENGLSAIFKWAISADNVIGYTILE
jgi:hypothetical protein